MAGIISDFGFIHSAPGFSLPALLSNAAPVFVGITTEPRHVPHD